MFNVDWQKLINQSLPSFLRRDKMKAWLYALIEPIEVMHNNFLTFRDDKLIELSYNAQTILLEKALNDRWPGANGNIYVDNTADNLPDNFIFRDQDTLPDLKIYRDQDSGNALYSTRYLFRDQDSAKFDFIVKVPQSLTFNNAEMREFVDQYRKAGKRFKIETF